VRWLNESTEALTLTLCLPKRERKGPNAGIEELNAKGPVINATFLPDELLYSD
jgi:hypothetical protein